MEIAGKVVLITGGKRTGAEIARELARRGADIGLGYNRSRDAAERAADTVRSEGRRVTVVQADLRQASECGALVRRVAGDLGRLDVLVNMASVYIEKPFDLITEDDFSTSLAVDLAAAYHCARASVPCMRAAGAGRIINFSDWTAHSGRPRYRGYLPYYVAKTGVIGLTQALALELAADGILVNAIAPGPIEAPVDLDAGERRSVEQATPLGRWGGAAALATVVAALIESDFMTGEVLRVDGGRHLL